LKDKEKEDGPDQPESSFPSQKDLEKEISEYLAKKYGGKVKVVSHMNFSGSPDQEESDHSVSGTTPSSTHNFNINPEELEEYLHRYVIKQDEAKAILATKVCTHFRRISYMSRRSSDRLPVGGIKNNILLMGPTGVGKTYLVKLIAAKLGVPFVKGDATKFSETGYVGGDVEDLVRDLVKEAGGDIEKAQYGIIYIDEIDKIASSGSFQGPDVSRAGVQRALLKPLEETEVDLKVAHDPIAQLEAIEQFRKTGKREKRTINTKHILFIVSGAFNGLSDIIKKRLSRQGIGFGADLDLADQEEWLKHVKPQDLVEYGFENEFIGRLPVIARLHSLEEEDLFQILKNPNSNVIISKKQDFRAYGIDLRFEDDALRLLAHQAYQEGTGARALVSVLERALLPFEKRLPSTDIDFLVVTRELVQDPAGELERLMADPGARERREHYEAILHHEMDLLLRSLKGVEPAPWRAEGIKSNDFRLRLVAQQCLKEDISPDEAAANVLFWINQIRSYEDSFFNRCEIDIVFEDEAIDRLLERCQDDPADLYTQCERLTSILEYGLSLIREKTGQNSFSIPAEAVNNTELFINRLIRQSYDSAGIELAGKEEE